MSEDLPIKEILAASSPIIKSIVETFLSPKLQKLKKKISIDYVNITSIEDYFTEYFLRSYEKYSVLNTLVFNNTEKLLKDIYIPLSIKEIVKDDKKELVYEIDGFPYSLGAKYKKILITDTAGMGKSTLVKRIFLDIVDKGIGIPIIIELRRLNKDKTILNELNEQLSSINEIFNEDLLLNILNCGDFIFFFDGYDEIPLVERDIVTKDLQKFIDKTKKNRFFITSRPENALTSFGDFHQFYIEPLKKVEAFQLLKRYDSNGKISNLLISKLKEAEYRNIDEFLTNPLLVSLLFTAFEYKQVIPFKKHIFYRQVYDANFESHDLTKGDSYIRDKHSQLDIDDFHRVLRHLGYSCLKEQKIEFSKDELLNLILKSKEFCIGLSFKESDFLNDLISTVPLFTKDGVYYRWSHKSLQEYFAAQFIYLDSKDLQKKILGKILINTDIQKFQNILDLYHDIDYKTFRDIFIFDILKEFEIYSNAIMSFKGINEKLLINRIEFTFLSTHFIFKAAKDDIDKEIRIILQGLEKDRGMDIYNIMGVMFDDKNNVYSFEYPNSKRSVILRILFNKKNSIVKAAYRNHKNSAEINLERKYFGLPIFIDDNPENLLNKPQYFSAVNNILKVSNFSNLMPSYIECLKELKSIEDENINEPASQDYLLSGL